MSTSISPDERTGCAVCGRHLLPGERATSYVDREGAEVEVCELCKARAEATGWTRPDEAASAPHEERHPRRVRGGQFLGGIAERAREARDSRRSGGRSKLDRDLSEEIEAAGTAARRRRERPATTDRPAVSESKSQGRSAERGSGRAGVTLPEGLRAFNASDQRRIVAGLQRSLGEPAGSALAIRTEGGAPGVRITVIWELAWYQWEVGPGKRGPAIRQAAKGSSIDELRAADRTFNLEIGTDGNLALKQGSGADPEAGGGSGESRLDGIDRDPRAGGTGQRR